MPWHDDYTPGDAHYSACHEFELNTRRWRQEHRSTNLRTGGNLGGMVTEMSSSLKNRVAGTGCAGVSWDDIAGCVERLDPGPMIRGGTIVIRQSPLRCVTVVRRFESLIWIRECEMRAGDRSSKGGTRLKKITLAALVFPFSLFLSATLIWVLFSQLWRVGLLARLPENLWLALGIGGAMALAYVPARFAYRLLYSWQNENKDACCTACGYDLTGSVSGTCSECGESTRLTASNKTSCGSME